MNEGVECKWLEKLNHEKNTDGKIDGVRKHTYNLELDFRLIGKAEEETCGPHTGQRHLPYLSHLRLLFKRAESFFLPSPCPVYTSGY